MPNRSAAWRGATRDNAPVLVVAGPGALPWDLADAIRHAGHAVVVCGDAVSGMQAALLDPPVCIVSDVGLPDGDGHSLAAWLRAHDIGPLASTTFVLRTPEGDLDARLRGYRAGADVCISQKLTPAETAAQVEALLRFARRERTAIEGSLAALPLASLLTALELEQRTGLFEVESEGCTAQLELVSGVAVSGRLLGAPAPPLEALRAMLGWTSGRFSFRSVTQIGATPRRASTVQFSPRELLCEAARLQDEATAA